MTVTEDKLQKLKKFIYKHNKIAVAFSGGIDSTFLLYFAIETLGGENVMAFSCTSAVNSANGLANMRKVFSTHFAEKTTLFEVELFPLTWKEFTLNSDKRCYYCKKRMYSAILDEVKKHDCFILADGTNVDDLKGDRPGLRAIVELNVQTPLVEAGLTKYEIRNIAKAHGLINHALPSNSCLATRVKKDKPITSEILEVVEKAEDHLRSSGFLGCRVKVDGSCAVIELSKEDFNVFVKDSVRTEVLKKFCQLGLKDVSLSLTCR